MKPHLIEIPILLLISLLICPGSASSQEFTESIRKPVHQSVSIRKKTQQASDRWQAEKEKRIAAFEALETRRAQLLTDRAELEKRLATRQAHNRKLADQLTKLEAISRDIEPFLEETYARLADLLRRDPALLPKERSHRLARLETLLQDPAMDVGEKYRKTMEALFIEAEYGNTVDVFQQTIDVASRPLTVTILRLGRLALFYQSMDGKTCGYWDRAAANWQTLDGSHARGIGTAIEIARKQRPAQMVFLPIGRMVAK